MNETNILGHYDTLIEENERIAESKRCIYDLIDQLRKDGAVEPVLIELEGEIEYVLSQWKLGITNEFHTKCRIDELNEQLEEKDKEMLSLKFLLEQKKSLF